MPESSTTSDADRRALLKRVCQLCVDELDIDHASIGISLGPGDLVSGAASSAEVADLDEYGFLIGEGPCFDAIRDLAPIEVADLGSEQARARWPAWTTEAAKREICAATALPIEIGAIPVGALGLYAESPWQLDERQREVAERFRGLALLVLLDLARSSSSGGGVDGVLDAGDDELAALLRGDVHDAAALLAAEMDVPMADALSRLRAYAFSVDRSLPAAASDVLSGRLRIGDLTQG